MNVVEVANIAKELNKKQKQAVFCQKGPLLVIAGAGAGKTKVITHRIARLLKNGAKPEEILAVTFTNKAAEEIKKRVANLLNRQIPSKTFQQRITIGTFHSICANILKKNSRKINLPRRFSISDKEDCLEVLKQALINLQLNPRQFEPVKMLSFISRRKADLVSLKDFKKTLTDHSFPKTAFLIWKEYEQLLKKYKTVDFDDLILKTVLLFQKEPRILEKYRKKWKYILIDEYQDTNRAQYVLTKMLAKKHKNICVVADEDQSIYGFRGADFGNVFKFEKDWPGAKIIVLEQNYRSQQKILEAANAVISRNRARRPKNLFSEIKNEARLDLFEADNEKEEADSIAQKTCRLLEDKEEPAEIAVLFRTNFQSQVIEESFLKHRLPYQVISSRFFEKREIKSIIAYLKASLNPFDLLSIQRIINEPPRAIETDLLTKNISKKELFLKSGMLKDFFELLEEIKAFSKKQNPSKVLSFIIKKSGLENYYLSNGANNRDRLSNLQQLIEFSKKYDNLGAPRGLEKLLEEISLFTDQDSFDKSKKAVSLMTIHSAKGLEFNTVFIAGLEEGLFPYIRGQNLETKEEEEERRLFYVALTRAKQKIFLSYAKSRTVSVGKKINKPSRFLSELPEQLLNYEK
jgi:DNA helicase-2/ATP-dependent DNA helicase PcrA